MQASVVAHAVDHEFVDHTEWCQLLSSAEHQYSLAVDDLVLNVFGGAERSELFHSILRVGLTEVSYQSRAPPRA